MTQQAVLLVESDSSARAILAALLRARFDVAEFVSGSAALKWLARGNIPGVIVFVRRAGDDSEAFFTIQRGAAAWAAIPTVKFSAESARLTPDFVSVLVALAEKHCQQTVH